MIVGFEAIFKFVPSIYFETTGYAFTYPIFYYLAKIPVCCYVHYPTISVDMLNNVAKRNFAFNNRYLISRSKILTSAKMFYYKIFSKLYSLCGRCASCIMVNSTWTLGHINNLWSVNYRSNVVFPPCDVETFSMIENPKRDDNFFIASVAQFRPEKNHQLQIKSFHRFIEK
jgi:alpha-1,2-mannosyltransferase